jgi:para-nitrobenzyl esterase
MRRNILSWILAVMMLGSGIKSFAQCEMPRYFDKIFSDVVVTTDLLYGSNYSYNALNGEVGLEQQDLFLDIYTPPLADTNYGKRPVIIFAHGGSFLGGVKEDKDIVYFCNEYAKRGFVTASIQYRLGYELPIDSVNATRAVYRALQDGRAAIRYIKSVANQYYIDTNKVYFGGTSAGAFIALNMAYLNLPSEVPSYVDTSARTTTNIRGLDGIEGKTNALTNSSKFHGIINFCGATKTVAWMNDAYSKSIPVISMHGTEDGTVPYGTRVINLNDLTPLPPQPAVPIVEVQGSCPIHEQADKINTKNAFYTWYGADHVPYINFDTDSIAALYMDTLMSFTTKHINELFFNCTNVDGLEPNASDCDINTSVKTQTSNVLKVYPNPAQDQLFIGLDGLTVDELSVYGVDGSLVYHRNGFNGLPIDTKDWKTGMYFIRIQSGNEVLTKPIIKK